MPSFMPFAGMKFLMTLVIFLNNYSITRRIPSFPQQFLLILLCWGLILNWILNSIISGFVIEERVSESRLGLDVPNDVALADWKDLAWNHFVADSGDDSSVDDNFYGKYLNGLSPISEAIDDIENLWNSSSAWIAKNTLQQPVRIVISANQLIPGS